MKRVEVIERVKELMHEKEKLIREHEDLVKKDKLLIDQLQMSLAHMGDE